MKIDYWYGNKKKAICFVDCFAYPNSGFYAGNIYDKNKKAIGDFTSKDSLEIEKTFPGIFGK